MPDESSHASRIGATIPFFFYDVIARITPAAFLLAGLFFIHSNGSPVTSLRDKLVQFPSESFSAGFAIVGFLLFVIAAYLIGILLDSISIMIIERPWHIFSPLRLADLRRCLALNDNEVSNVETILEQRFGIELEVGRLEEGQGRGIKRWLHNVRARRQQHQRIIQCGQLCMYATHEVNERLGNIGTRWDAEAILGRSTLMSSLLLIIAIWLDGVSALQKWIVLIHLVSAGGAAFVWYCFTREKQFFGRFQLFHVVSTPRGGTRPQGLASW